MTYTGSNNMKDRGNLPREALVRIYVNGEFLSSLLCTPSDLKELAVGWLYNEGLVQTIDEIASLAVNEDLQEIHVHLNTDRHIESSSERVIRTSACMGGKMSYRNFLRNSGKPKNGLVISLGTLKFLMRRTLVQASLYKATGGIHCTGIASVDGESLSVFEDVGRHNAFDKAIGRMLLSRDTPERKVLLTSGRISSEMALKAARSEIPIVASISTGTDLAVTIAEDADLTVVGRVMSASPAVLCGEQRILRIGDPQGVHNKTGLKELSHSHVGEPAR